MDFGSAGTRVGGTPNRLKQSRNIRDTRNLNKRTFRSQEEEDIDKKYPCALNLYPVPPVNDISLETFEDLAVLRLRVSCKLKLRWANNLIIII